MEVFLSGSIDKESGSDQWGTLCRLVTHHGLTTRTTFTRTVCAREVRITWEGARSPPLRGYVGQRRVHKLIVAAQRNHIASLWTGRIRSHKPKVPRGTKH